MWKGNPTWGSPARLQVPRLTEGSIMLGGETWKKMTQSLHSAHRKDFQSVEHNMTDNL